MGEAIGRLGNEFLDGHPWGNIRLNFMVYFGL